MITDAMLETLQERYRLNADLAMLRLPSSGVSLLRWRLPLGQPPRLFERDPMDAYLLSMTLQPMRAQSWMGASEAWCGTLGANMIWLIPPGAEIRWRSDSGFDLLHIVIPPKAFEALAGSDRSLHDTFRGAVPLYVRDDVAAGLARTMIRAAEDNKHYAVQFADAVSQALLAHLLGDYQQAEEICKSARLTPRTLRRVQSYIAENLHRDIRVGDLASVAGLSLSHFARAFRESAGIPPHKYVTDVRLERAEQCIATSDASVLQVALDCGYKDASNFAKSFKRRFGKSPQDYRRNVASN